MIPLALTLASAVLYGLAMPPTGWWPLAWVALAPLLIACALVRPGTAAGLGLVWGMAAATATGHWMPGMLADFFGIGAGPAWLGHLAIAIASCGLYTAPFAALASFASRRGSWGVLAVGGAWGAVELARAHLLLQNPWALLGYSQQPVAPLVQSSDLLGPFGLGMLLAAVSALVATALAPSLRRGPLLGPAAGIAIGVAATLLYGSVRLATEFGHGEPVRVALVQPSIERDQRYVREQRMANLERHLALTESTFSAEPALVLWPEFAIDFYLKRPSPERDRLLAASRGWDADLLFGAPDARLRRSGTETTNSVFVMRHGQPVGRYDKAHLMPFSETNPLRGLARVGHDRYVAGVGADPLQTRAFSVGALLCSEAMLPGYARQFGAAGAEVLVNPTNDDWFGDESAQALQLASVAFRAVENRRYLLRPSANGYTAVIDPHGRVVARAPRGTPETLLAEVRPSTARTFYQERGDAAPAALAGLSVLWLLRPVRGVRRES